MHHRSDSLSSGITALAIFGSYAGFPVLDPLGGLVVAALIGKQGVDLFLVSMAELSDRSVPLPILESLNHAIESVARAEENEHLVRGWKDLRATKSGVSTFVDVRLSLVPDISLRRAWEVQSQVQEACGKAVRGAKEVRVLLEPLRDETTHASELKGGVSYLTEHQHEQKHEDEHEHEREREHGRAPVPEERNQHCHDLDHAALHPKHNPNTPRP